MILNVSYVHICCFTALVFSIGFESGRCDEGLLFNWYKLKLVQKPSNESESICKNCASARTALNSRELNFNYYESTGKRALFLKKVYPPSKYMNEIHLPKCDKPGEPSIVLNTDKRRIEIGYEISRTTIINDNRSTHEEFPSKNKSAKPDKLYSLYPADPKQKPNPRYALSNYYYLYRNFMKIDPKNSPDFIWIPVLLFTINTDTYRTILTEYNPDLGMHVRRENCSKFNVAKEFYTADSFDSFYSHENQKNIFEGSENQPALSPELNSESSGEEYECGQKYGCLVQHQIIPSYYFHSNYGALAACTLMNTVPIWKSVVERINIVDKYLYAITQIGGPNIHLKNGFFGTLESSKKYTEKNPKLKHEIYLDKKNDITVPLIFYKIVEYKVSKHPSRPNKTDNYFAVIVIHNNFASDTDEQKICKEKDTIAGWEDIQNGDSQSGLTYVCQLTKNIANKLEAYGKSTFLLDLYDELRLRMDLFPTFDAAQTKYSYEDKRPEIRNKIKELFEKKED